MNEQSINTETRNNGAEEVNTSIETVELFNSISQAEVDTQLVKKIIIVDDELFGFRKSHISGVCKDFYQIMEDVNDPRFEQIINIGKEIDALKAIFEGSYDSIMEYIASDDAANDFLSKESFISKITPQLTQILNPFLERVERTENIRRILYQAFPEVNFNLEFQGERPTTSEVLECDGLFLDLFLENNSVNPVKELTDYLQQLAHQAENHKIPPIILMSTHPELQDNQLNFSKSAHISAAGLMILTKDKMLNLSFGSLGIKLSFDQLIQQNDTAHAMRLLIKAWLNALDNAKFAAAKTLWNLDASAMQQIHFASYSDNDPYEQHIHELLCREHLAYIEADKEVIKHFGELDFCFQSLLTEDKQNIENRLIAPISDVRTGRTLMSHFTWLGMPLPETPFYDEPDPIKRIANILPFGSVVSTMPVQTGSKCLIHITQQCDLNDISRKNDDNGTLIFAYATATEFKVTDEPFTSTTQLFARNLQINQNSASKEFDLEITPKHIMALPVKDFLNKASQDSLQMIGRLRNDIASHVTSSVSRHISRPASQKMIRPAMYKAKIFIQSASDTKATPPRTIFEQPGSQIAKVFQVTKIDDFYSFQDDACIWIALWLTAETEQFGISLDVTELCLALRKGWRSERNLLGHLTAKVVEYGALNRAFKALSPTTHNCQFSVVLEVIP
jgi:hypothetical protein